MKFGAWLKLLVFRDNRGSHKDEESNVPDKLLELLPAGGIGGFILSLLAVLGIYKRQENIRKEQKEFANKFTPRAECVLAHKAVDGRFDRLEKAVEKQGDRIIDALKKNGHAQ